MSTYVREKVLRIPYEKTGLQKRFANCGEARDFLEENHADLFDYATVGKFQFAPTESDFIDYVIDYEYDAYGEFGKVRELYSSEFNKYARIFAQIMPDAEFSAIRLVEFCWYNGCEAPDYYNAEDDDFYNEI